MKVNVKKTKTMNVSKLTPGILNITMEGGIVEQKTKFRYLGFWITEDGSCETEVKARIAMANKYAYRRRQELFKRNMSLTLKKRIVKALVWSEALFECETWTMKKDKTQRLRALEMWIWRTMKRVKWNDMKTNEQVLSAVGERRKIIETIVNRKKIWIGHILRGDGLLKDVIEGRIEGKLSGREHEEEEE